MSLAADYIDLEPKLSEDCMKTKMQASVPENAAAMDVIDLSNCHDFAYQEFCKLSADGAYVYVKRIFANGFKLYSRYDNNDPGQNEDEVSRQAYAAVRFPEIAR